MLSLLLHLQVRGQLTGPELAQRLEVSERTVQRDVESLVAAGVPIRSCRGPAGGYRLEAGYQTRLTGVAADEAHALAFLGLSGPADELGLTGLLDNARTKVWAALTGEARDRVQRTAQRFHLDPVRWYGRAEPTPNLGSVSTAVWHDRRVRVTLVRDNQTVERTLDPLGLVLAAGEWYLVAQRQDLLRTYRVSRLTKVEVLEEAAHRPEAFDLAQSWAERRRQLELSHTLVNVTVRIAGSALPRLRSVIAVSGQEALEPNDPLEWVIVTVPFEGEPWAATTLLGLGSQVEVLEPPSLRARMSDETRAAAAHYNSV